ncbi:unnamed protein product [Gulo gulo]|uniref:Uncharacterized protein n=1 Tax=Gulo gulo TaxID=48420 RepID=A0A9X9LQ98_GULGU|nr:unnamed protein product [Gulo gulo]
MKFGHHCLIFRTFYGGDHSFNRQESGEVSGVG